MECSKEKVINTSLHALHLASSVGVKPMTLSGTLSIAGEANQT